jgi:hypothetical protein
MAGQEVQEQHRTKTTKEIRHLRVPLTDKELLAHGDRLASLLDQHRGLEAEETSIRQQYKAKISEVEAQVESEQVLVRNKSEIRKVDCLNVLDYTDVMGRTYRMDTGECIEERKLSEDEKQSSLPFDGEEAETKQDEGPAFPDDPEASAALEAADAKRRK